MALYSIKINRGYDEKDKFNQSSNDLKLALNRSFETQTLFPKTYQQAYHVN